MKNYFFFALIGLLVASVAQGQTKLGIRTTCGKAQSRSFRLGADKVSTYQEGWLRGMADRVRAQGEYNRNTAAAALILQQARKSHLDNDLRQTEVFWQKRDLHDSRTATHKILPSQAEKPVPTAAQRTVANVSQVPADPSRVDFRWPVALNHPAFDAGRAQLSDLFAQRSGRGTSVGSPDQKIRSTCAEMRTLLAGHIREVSPRDYLEARSLLEQWMRQPGLPAADRVALRKLVAAF